VHAELQVERMVGTVGGSHAGRGQPGDSGNPEPGEQGAPVYLVDHVVLLVAG
jgi:hypothetical protein